MRATEQDAEILLGAAGLLPTMIPDAEIKQPAGLACPQPPCAFLMGDPGACPQCHTAPFECQP